MTSSLGCSRSCSRMPGHPRRSRRASRHDRARPEPRARQPGSWADAVTHRGGARPRPREAHRGHAARRAQGAGGGRRNRARAAARVPAGRRRTPARPSGQRADGRAARAAARSGASDDRMDRSRRLAIDGIRDGLRLKSDVAAGAATVLARLAVRRGGRAGLVLCGGQSELLIPPRRGRRASATSNTPSARAWSRTVPATTPASAAPSRRLSRLARSPGHGGCRLRLPGRGRLGPAAARDRSSATRSWPWK